MHVLLVNGPISFQSYEFLIPMEYTPLASTGRFDECIFSFSSSILSTPSPLVQNSPHSP